MRILHVALLQMTPHGNDQDANCSKGELFCRQARDKGADIALFPELWNIGYTPPCEDFWSSDVGRREAAAEAWTSQAIEKEAPFVRHYQQLARELGMAIGITYLEKWPGKPRNTLSIIDRFGGITMTYAKVHTCDFYFESLCTPGEDFSVCTLDTEKGPVKVGAMICFDREFPESARVLMLKGAEIILTPNACPMEEHRTSQFRTRAFENMVGVALSNYAGEEHRGHSVAFEPIAFDETGSRDMTLVRAGEEEGVYIASFDLERLRAYRANEVWGDAYRKPRAYQRLIDQTVQQPFVRQDAKR